ncbi:MAG: RraA family protein [Candidatus Solibacter sp.]
MASSTLQAGQASEISARFLQLYTGAIADILDKHGYRNQLLPSGIAPFTVKNRVAGTAFTVQGYPCADVTHDDTEIRLKTLDSALPGCVTVVATGGSMDCAHWGEIMSTAVQQRGSTGAVVDGGLRDLDFVNAMNFPVFAKFRHAATLAGRWGITESQVVVKIGNTVIAPGDFIFGDVDGVVVVPQKITMDVLVAAEDIQAREKGMREELRAGVSVIEAFKKYGAM